MERRFQIVSAGWKSNWLGTEAVLNGQSVAATRQSFKENAAWNHLGKVIDFGVIQTYRSADLTTGGWTLTSLRPYWLAFKFG